MPNQQDFNNGFCLLVSEEATEGDNLNRFTFSKDSTSQTPGVESELVILAKPSTFTVGKYYIFAVTVQEAP